MSLIFSKTTKKHFHLILQKAPPNIIELKPFHDELCDLGKNLKFRKFRNNFHRKLKTDLNKIRSNDKIIIKADKTRNYYETEKEDYLQSLRSCITSNYKKAKEDTIDNIAKGDKEIATQLDIADRVYATAKSESYITLKDHKPNY